MATVTIANLIHRAEMDTDLTREDVPVTTLTWQRGIPVCVCGEDITTTPYSRVTCNRIGRPVIECASCGAKFLIQEDK